MFVVSVWGVGENIGVDANLRGEDRSTEARRGIYPPAMISRMGPSMYRSYYESLQTIARKASPLRSATESPLLKLQAATCC